MSKLEYFGWTGLFRYGELRHEEAALLESAHRGRSCDLRVIVRLAQMPQDHELRPRIEVLRQKVRGHQIRKMPDAAEDALLYGPRIWPYLQHLDVVVGLDHQQVAVAQVKLHRFRNVSEVVREPDLHALRPEAKPDRIHGVVRNAEALHLDVADPEARARLEGLQNRHRRLPVDCRRGELRHVERLGLLEPPRQDGDAGDVVRMFVGDQDGVDLFEVLADGRHALPELLHTEPRVDQDARILGGQQRRIARTAACQHAEFDDGPPPLTLQNTPNPARTKWSEDVSKTNCIRSRPAARIRGHEDVVALGGNRGGMGPAPGHRRHYEPGRPEPGEVAGASDQLRLPPEADPEDGPRDQKSSPRGAPGVHNHAEISWN